MAKKAIILGASGLVGGELLRLLLEHSGYSEVYAIVRRSLNIKNPKFKEVITDFENLEALKKQLPAADVLFSCLGTTSSKTPDQRVYRKIDLEIPVTIAKYAKEVGLQSCHIVSALGANAQSSGFYIRLKGEVEEEMKNLHLVQLHIYRPSLIKGNRKEQRLFEKAFIKMSPFLDLLLTGPLKKYKSIEAHTIASAMLNQSLKPAMGTFVYPSDKIKEQA